MRAIELIKRLASLEPESEVLISGDPEGNDYRTIDEVVAVQDQNLKEHIVIYPTDTLIDIQ